MKSVVECLAQIRLNPTSVEQFLGAACSLADDNPEIKSQVYEAAKEARAASLLIDHLRNLFSHQHSIDLQRQLTSRHHQQQQQHWHVGETTAGGGVGDMFGSQLQAAADSQSVFTYSNQLTLYKSSKCLVASVAKILFLADSVVLSLAAGPAPASAPPSTSTTRGASGLIGNSSEPRQQYFALNKVSRLEERASELAQNNKRTTALGSWRAVR